MFIFILIIYCFKYVRLPTPTTLKFSKYFSVCVNRHDGENYSSVIMMIIFTSKFFFYLFSMFSFWFLVLCLSLLSFSSYFLAFDLLRLRWHSETNFCIGLSWLTKGITLIETGNQKVSAVFHFVFSTFVIGKSIFQNRETKENTGIKNKKQNKKET